MQKGFIASAERDKALFVERGAAEAVRTAQAQQVASADAQVANSRAIIKQREAALASARNDLSKTSITAPVDGVVISRQVEPGQTVAASLNTPTLFTIAQDLSQMQVDVAIDESDIGRIRPGQRVSFTVDAPRTFEGTVQQIRKAAQNVQNVVTYTVVVGTSNPSLTLLPGMTANARVVTDQRNDVLKVRTRRCAGVRHRGGEGRQPRAGIGERRRGRGPAGPAPAARRGAETRWRAGRAPRRDLRRDAHAHGRTARPAGIRSPSTGRTHARGGSAEDQRDAQCRAAASLRELVASDTGRGGGASGSGRVPVPAAAGPQEVRLRTGLSDGNATEIASGPIKEGDEVIVGTVQSGVPSTTAAPARRGFRSSARRCLSRPVIW